MRSTELPKLTPPQLATRWGVSPDKVLEWIHTGELRATNLATRRVGRPRWRIDWADVVAFEEARVAIPATPRRRRRQPNDTIFYF
jgi:excisionase family DNA binding protein